MRCLSLASVICVAGAIATFSPAIAAEIPATEQRVLAQRAIGLSPEARRIRDRGRFQEVRVGPLETYTHPSGLFSLPIPQNWTLSDNSKPDEVIVLWFDPAQNASIGVDIFDAPYDMSRDDLSNLLQQFLQGTFGTQTNFSMSAPQVQSDGSIRVTWGYVESVEGGSGWLQGNSFIALEGNKVSILNVFFVGSQYDSLRSPLSRMINNYEVNEWVEVP